MKAVILAGGLGTRLRPVTYEIPKPLVPVKKKPIVNHLIELFAKHGIRDVGLLVSRDHEEDFYRWRKAWQDDLSEGQVSIFYEERPRGTFGGLGDLREWLDEPFILSNGDELKDFDLTSLAEFHRAQGGLGTIALVEVPDPSNYGVPVLDDNRITDFLEKPSDPPSNFVSSGLYILDPSALDYADFSKDVVMIEKDVFPRLAEAGKLFGHRLKGRWFDCGTLERWERAMREW